MDGFILEGPAPSRTISSKLRCTLRNLTMGPLGCMREWMDSELVRDEVENTVFVLRSAEKKTVVVGWAQLHYDPADSFEYMHKDCIALSVFVKEEYRGRGAGKFLAEVATAYAKASGKTVQIYPSCAGSRAVYKSLLNDPHVINGYEFEPWNDEGYEDLLMY